MCPRSPKWPTWSISSRLPSAASSSEENRGSGLGVRGSHLQPESRAPNSEPRFMKVAVIGVGHQGRYHARHMKALDGVTGLVLIDRDIDKAKALSSELQAEFKATYQECLADFDAAVIAVPTIDH